MNRTNLIKQTLLCLNIFSVSNAYVIADSYNSEASLNYIDRDNSTTYYVKGEYFFTPVSTKGHPLAEANFLADQPVSVVLSQILTVILPL